MAEKSKFEKFKTELFGESLGHVDRLKHFIKNFVPMVKKKWPVFLRYIKTTEGIISTTFVVTVLFALFLIIQSCAPRKGTIIYGICGAFLEQHVPYPQSIRHQYVEQYRKGVRIYYTHVDGFGQYLSELIECTFVQDPQKGVQVDQIFMSHIKEITEKERVRGKGRLYLVKPEVIELFNESRSPAAIVKNEPDLTLPSY